MNEELTKEKAAELLRVSVRTVERYMRAKLLNVRYEPVTPYKMRALIPRSDVESILDKRALQAMFRAG